MLREAGIENINLDLIYAIPSQTMGMLKADLDQLLAINPEHLSCYALTYEPNTPLEVKLRKGAVLDGGMSRVSEIISNKHRSLP